MTGVVGRSRRVAHAEPKVERLRRALDVLLGFALVAVGIAGFAMMVTVIAYWMGGQDLVRDFLWLDR
jgi:hypothetical protein